MTNDNAPAGRAGGTEARVAEVLPAMQAVHTAVSEVLKYAEAQFPSCRTLPGWWPCVPQDGSDLVFMRRELNALNRALVSSEGLGRVLVFEAVRHAEGVLAAATQYVNGWCQLRALDPSLCALTSYARDLCGKRADRGLTVAV